MQLVARVERVDPPGVTEVATAAVLAVIGLLADERSQPGGEWADQFATWQREGRIRKLVRRARASAWIRAQEPDGHTASHQRAEVRAYVPSPMDQAPDAVAKLQIRSSSLGDEDSATSGHDGVAVSKEISGLIISITPEVAMSWGKQAAQCAHAGQLLWRDATPDQRSRWDDAGRPVSILRPDSAQFARQQSEAIVEVRDGGFTEIPAGTLTALSWWANLGDHR